MSAALFRDIVGAENVIEANSLIQEAQTATFATEQAISAIVKPANRAEVAKCIQRAHDAHLAIYPTSQGKNWGLGSKVPVSANNILIDLCRLNQITQYCEQSGTLTIEPGVTFRQLSDFLKSRDSDFFCPVIGGSPEASVLANILERGDRVASAHDKLNIITSMEIILADGSTVNTGYGSFSRGTLANIDPYGVGPSLNGLFTQSNLGIVTQLSIRLTARPRAACMFYFMIKDCHQLENMIIKLSQLQRDGLIAPNTLSLWNSYKMLAKIGKTAPIETDQLKQLLLAEPWHGSACIFSASSEIVEGMRTHVEKTLEDSVSELHFHTIKDTKNAGPASLFFGEPSSENLASLYWGKKGSELPHLANPERDQCGIMWLCPAVPFIGEAISQANSIIEEVTHRYNFEPNIGMVVPEFNLAYVFVALLYDRNEPNRDEDAQACHDELLEALQNSGFLPSRLGIQSMEKLEPRNNESQHLLTTIKRALDPHNIIAPGRYIDK